jgi:hypothetical protein
MVPLSKDTVSKWIHEINTETDNEVTERIKSSQCSALQLDKTMDDVGIAVFLLSPGTSIKMIIQMKLNCYFASPWRLGLAGRIFLTLLTHLKEKGLSRDEGIDVCTDGVK